MEPRYNEVLGTMKFTLLYQVSHYIRVKKLRNKKNRDQQNYLVIRGFCYIRPLNNEVPLYYVYENIEGSIFCSYATTANVIIFWHSNIYTNINNITLTCVVNNGSLYSLNTLVKITRRLL